MIRTEDNRRKSKTKKLRQTSKPKTQREKKQAVADFFGMRWEDVLPKEEGR